MATNKKKLIFLLSLLFPCFLGVAPGGSTFSLSSPVYGPYQSYEKDSNLTISISTTSLITYSVYGQINFLDANSIAVATSKSSSVSISKYSSGTLYLAFLTENYLTTSGLKCIFQLLDASSSSVYLSSTFTIYPIKSEHYNPLDYISSGLSLSPTSFCFSGSKVVTYAEKYNFSSFLDYFLIDQYYRLIIDQYNFTYSFFKTIKLKSATLFLPSPAMCFSSLPTNDDGDVEIPLAVSLVNGKMQFSFNQDMYVNPKTLDMAFEPLTGYVKTSYFYFPKNHLVDILNQTFVFSILDVGDNLSCFSWNTYFLSEQSLLGPCNSSDYCVVGGIVQ